MVSDLSVQQAQVMRFVEDSRRVSFAAFALLMLFATVTMAANAGKQEAVYFDIPRLRAEVSLTQFAEQADITLLFSYDVVQGKNLNRVKGSYSIEIAIDKLLAGTGLGPIFNHQGLLTAITDQRSESGEKQMSVSKKTGLVAILAAVFLSPAGKAQETDGAILEEVIVFGDRLVNRNFVATKRNAVHIVDSIGENETGGLAAANAAELLTRIPGLNAFEDLSGRGSGGSGGSEVRFVSIRGIRPDLNLTLLDGLALAVPNFENRAQFLDWFPVNLAGRTDVVKTFTADMDPAAIGGQINFVTRRGLDHDEPLLTLIAEMGQTELDTSVQSVDNPLRLEALFVGSLTDRLGLAVSASYNKRDIGRPSQLTRGRSRSIDFPEATGVRVVREHRILSESAPTERLGLSAKLDYAPEDETYVWFTAAYNTVDQTIHHAKTDVRIPSSATGLTLDPSGQSGTLRIDDSGVTFGLGRAAFSEVGEFLNDSNLVVLQAGYEKRFNDEVTLLVKGGYSDAYNSRDAEYYLFMRAGGRTDLAFDGADTAHPRLDVIDPLPVTYFDPGQYRLLYRNLLPEVAQEDVLDIQASIAFNADPDDEGWGGKTGLRYKKTDRSYDFVWTTHYDIANETLEGSGFTLADVYASKAASLSPPGSQGAFPAFFGDIRAINALITPSLSDAGMFRFESLEKNEFGSDYAIEEVIRSAFIQGTYQATDFQAVFGMRYEETTTDGAGFRDVNGIWQAATSSGTNRFFLPSALVNLILDDDITLRFAASQTLGRPAFPEIAPTGEAARLGLQNTLSRSNPDLKPRLSTNLDLSAEWYFTADSLLALALFSKQIKDEILMLTTSNVVIGNITYDEVTEPVNATSADMLGIELSFVTYFDFLPAPFDGLGISFNGMWTDASLKTDGSRGEVDFLLNQPNRIANLSLLYTSDKFDVNISWNRTSRIATTFNPANANADRFNVERTTLSARALYYWNDHLQVYVNGINLTSEDSVEFTGEGVLYHNRLMGRTVNLGVTYSF